METSNGRNGRDGRWTRMLAAAGLVMAVAATTVGAAARGGGAPASDEGGTNPQVERGRYLVTMGVCNDCHTPLKMGPQGPEPDWSRMLSGHPEQEVLPPAPALPEGPWQVLIGGSLTAFSGPWGTSFTANLTPDPETGIGEWTEDEFIATLRAGRHRGRGREILPPMPWIYYGQGTDEDLKAIFAYLRTLPPVHNRVPAPIPPPAR